MREISLEFNAPLLKDSVVQDLSFGAAYRGIDYDSSGFVSTYKVGFTSQVNDLIRLRASYSQDIRAANLVDLYGQPTTDGTSVRDPRTGITNPMFIIRQGNPNLVPETSRTSTAGIVLTPFRGLVASLDWYRINIKDVINSGFPVSVIVANCVAGDAASCSNIYYGDYPRTYCSGPGINDCPVSLPLFGVVSRALNADNMSTEGVDFVGSYTTPFGNGTLNVSADANFVFNQMFTTRGSTCNVANSLSSARSTYPGCTLEGNPKFRGNVGIGYAQGGWRGSVNARLVGAAHIVNRWTSGVQVPDNDTPFMTYIDGRLSYNFAPLGLTVYGAIDNILNKSLVATPVTPYTGPTLGDIALRDDIYDGYGRVWRLGVRMKF
jgi:outer membrane receptor protein involved in Fe transport